jgi:hypothetical protein
LEFVAANSPATRYLTTARQLTDPRKHLLSKAANLLTGARVADVSPGAQDAILRSRANAVFKEIGGREFRRSYIPDEERLSPENRDLAGGLKELLAELAKRQRARKAQ